jgi:hypothetical protein
LRCFLRLGTDNDKSGNNRWLLNTDLPLVNTSFTT